TASLKSRSAFVTPKQPPKSSAVALGSARKSFIQSSTGSNDLPLAVGEAQAEGSETGPAETNKLNKAELTASIMAVLVENSNTLKTTPKKKGVKKEGKKTVHYIAYYFPLFFLILTF